MTDLPHLHDSLKQPARLAADLLHHYSFELMGYSVVQQIEIWLEYYPSEWLPLALIEALYQGRYKAISVEQILNLWQRREHPVYHFNHEFERLICSSLPKPSHATSAELTETLPPPLPKPALSYRKLLLELPSLQVSRLERLNEIPPFKLGSQTEAIVPSPSSAPPSNEPVLPQLPTPDFSRSSSDGKVVPFVSPRAIESELPKQFSDREFKEFKEGVIFGLSASLAVSSLKPRFKLMLCQYYTPNWLAFLDEPEELIEIANSNGNGAIVPPSDQPSSVTTGVKSD